MPRLQTLSGTDVLRVLSEFGFVRVSQRGSHIKVQRVTLSGARQTLTIPLHAEVDRGTLHAIFRQACRYIPENELRRKFFTE